MWIILLLFVAILVFIVIKVDKGFKTACDESDEIELPSSSPISDPKPVYVQKEQPKYVTIYEFSPKESIKICSYCDGENPIDTHHCSICGEEIGT